MRKFLIFITSLFQYFCLPANVLALESDIAVTQYLQQNWQNKEGLPQSTVTSISQTPDGYLWLGTLEGLVRFDGVRFTTFDTRTTSAFKHNIIVDLLTDSQGVLWIATSGGGLVSLKDSVFKRFSINEGLPVDQVSTIFEDKLGGLWIGTDGGGLAKFENDRFVTQFSDTVLGVNIRAVVENSEGLWIGSERGLFLIDNKKSILQVGEQQGFDDNNIRSLYFSQDNSLWIGTASGLYRLTNRQFTHFDDIELNNQRVLAIHQDRHKNLWIATDSGGLIRLQQPLSAYPKIQTTLDKQSIWAIFEDKDDNLWIGSHFRGLTRLKNSTLTAFATVEGLSTTSIRSVLETSNGKILVGTEGGGVNQLDDGHFYPLPKAFELTGRKIFSMLEDSKGALWFGTDEGLIRIFREQVTVYTTMEGLLSNIILSLFEDKLGDLWIGSYSGGLNRFKNGQFKSYSISNGLPNNTVNIIMQDSKGFLWIGTRGGGVARFDKGKFEVFSTKNGLSDDLVFALYEDQEGSLWIGTYGGGLNRLKDGKLSVISEQQGLFDNVIHKIIPDGFGQLWMTSNKGIFKASKKSLDDVADGLISNIESISYDVSDGMKNLECNSGANAGIISQQGQIWIPTVEGVIRFDPAKVDNTEFSAQVLIENLLLENREMNNNELNSLGPVINHLEIHYTATNLSEADKMRFRYRLEGFEKEWTYADSRRVAYYNQLPSGRYQFRVMAAFENNSWINESANLVFTVSHRYYETIWFRSLVLFFSIFIIYLLHRIRVLRLKRSNLELEQKIKQRTTQLQQANQLLERLVREDGLTGVLNRRAFNEILLQECRRSERNNSSLSLLIIDIDYFKQYNDAQGHPAGDACICEIVNVLTHTCCRAGESVARYGGDEFVVVLPGVDYKDAMELANKICQSVFQLGLLHPKSEVAKQVTVTIGLGCLQSNDQYEPARILESADRGLYLAKKKGRNQAGCVIDFRSV